MKDTEIHKLSDKELQERLQEERALMTKLKIQHAVSAIENPAKITAQRKLVARLLTETSARKHTTASAK